MELHSVFFKSWFTAIIYLCICFKIPIYLWKQLFRKREVLNIQVCGAVLWCTETTFPFRILYLCFYLWEFVLSDRRQAESFLFLSLIKSGSLYIPAPSSLLFHCLWFTLPLRLRSILFTHMFCWIFRSFITDTTMHSWSSSLLEVLTMTVCMCYGFLCVGVFVQFWNCR